MEKNSLSSTTLTKSLMLMEVLADTGSPMGLSDLVRKVGLPKSTCHRILSILVNERLVQFEQNSRTYGIGFRFMSLAFQTWQNLELRRAAIEDMQRLGKFTNENIHLAVPDGTEIVFIDRVESHEILRHRSAIGNRAGVHCTALGKAMLASMPIAKQREIVSSLTLEAVAEMTITDAGRFEDEIAEVRRKGYAIAIREHQSDTCAIAASISDFRDEVVGAVSVSAPVFRVDRKQLDAWAGAVMEAAKRISQNLGWTD